MSETKSISWEKEIEELFPVLLKYIREEYPFRNADRQLFAFIQSIETRAEERGRNQFSIFKSKSKQELYEKGVEDGKSGIWDDEKEDQIRQEERSRIINICDEMITEVQINTPPLITQGQISHNQALEALR
jgi:hypothetical protein